MGMNDIISAVQQNMAALNVWYYTVM